MSKLFTVNNLGSAFSTSYADCIIARDRVKQGGGTADYQLAVYNQCVSAVSEHRQAAIRTLFAGGIVALGALWLVMRR